MKTSKKYFVQLIGIRAELFSRYIRKLGCKVEVISRPQEISKKADICIAFGVHYMIKPKYLRIPRLGIWGAHESALPVGRGSAPLQWSVLNSNKELTVSFFQLIEKMDSGPLLGQAKCLIPNTALLEDIRKMALDLTKKLLKNNLLSFLHNRKRPYSQIGKPVYYRRRTPKDSRLDTTKRLIDLWNLIRVCDNEEYPAWFEIDKKRFILKRYHKND